MGMKGSNLYRMRGKYISFSLTALVGTTILLWAWENYPLVASLLSAQDKFVMPSSEILTGTTTHMDPFVSTDSKLDNEKDFSDSFLTREKTEEGIDVATRNFSATISSNRTEVDSESFKETKEILTGTTTDTDPVGSTNSKMNNEKDLSDSFRTSEIREKTEEGIDVTTKSSSATISTNRTEDDSESFEKTEDCNYAKGKWVADKRRPFYSGLGCKQWLSEMWACRMTQRTDFSYEGYRWQPENCRMPEFERSTFFKRMQDKTIAFVGDSLARQQFQSLMCMVTGGEEIPDVHNIGRQYGLVKARGAVRPDGWAYRFPSSNTTILFYWSATLCDLEPLNITDPKTDYAMHLDRPAAFLRDYLHTFDVLVLNTGHHWNRGKLVGNRWVMYVNGTPNNDKKLAQIWNAKLFAARSVVKWVDSQLLQRPTLKAFFRTISPRHFFNGDWNTGGTCDNTTPLAGGADVLQDKSSDPDIESAVNGSRVEILDITAISQLRDEGHVSRYTIRPVEGMQDCLHWCLPGIPDTWNELLYAQL